MARKKSIEQIIRADGQHPPEAYGFLQEALGLAVKQVHGDRSRLGGANHVTPRQLCLALRDLAVARWGMLARTVLLRWGIDNTLDFGKMVHFLVQHGQMKLTEQDTLERFQDVYDFGQAFGGDNRFEMKE